jgi:hypothetical protein
MKHTLRAALFAACTVVHAEWMPVPLEDLVHDSDFIVVAQLKDISTSTVASVQHFTGTLHISEIIRGPTLHSDRLTLIWANKLDGRFPKVEHQRFQGTNWIWFLTVNAPGTVTTTHPVSVYTLEERQELDEILAKTMAEQAVGANGEPAAASR